MAVFALFVRHSFMMRKTLKKLRQISWSQDRLLLILLLVFAIASLLALAYQAGAAARESSRVATIWREKPPHFALQVSYPKRLRLDMPRAAVDPVSVWLVALSPSAPPVTYTVTLEPSIREFSVSDKDGLPGANASGRLAARPLPSDAATWYIHRVPTNAELPQATIGWLAVRVADPSASTASEWDVPIELESSTGAFWRRLWDVVLGPTTPQIGLIGILLAVVWRTVEKYGEERTKQRKQRAVDDLASLEGLWLTKPSYAVDRYLDIFKRKSPDNAEIAGIFDRMWESEWCRRFIDQAVEAYTDKDDARAQRLAEYVEQQNGGGAKATEVDEDETESDLDSALIEARAILALVWSDRAVQARPTDAKKLDAIARLAIRRGTRLTSRLAQDLRELLNKDSPSLDANIKHLNQWREAKNSYPRWLLRQASVRQCLQELLKMARLGETRSSLQALLEAEEAYAWPRPSLLLEAPLELPDAVDVPDKLREIGWGSNPFVPDRVERESDKRLDEYYRPPLWDDLISDQPFVFSAKSGFGQTSALVKAARDWQRRRPKEGDESWAKPLMPVFAEVPALLAATTTESCYAELACEIVRTLLRFFAENPGSFVAAPYLRQRAISRLVLSQQERLGDLRTYMRGSDLVRTAEAGRIYRAITDMGQNLNSAELRKEADLLPVLGEVCLSDFAGFALILDLRTQDLVRHGVGILRLRLQTLFAIASDLGSVGIVLKAGLPPELAEQLHSDMPIPSLTWCDGELSALLRRRLSWAAASGGTMGDQQPALASLFRLPIPDADDQVVAAAKGSLRKLVDLGNALLIQLKKKRADELLNAEDLEQVIVGRIR